MSAILAGIGPDDEVIIPAYTFVSTALAFARQGATIVFADSRNDTPCIDAYKIESLITPRTKAIVPVHYAGIPCEMDKIMEIAKKNNLLVIEDAANSFGSRYKGRLTGTIGQLGCFSFHETKIIHCGEGGMLSINDDRFRKRAEIIWEKGTNRCDFHRGEVNKYEWIDTGSSFLMSDISASFLFNQLLEIDNILKNRKYQWELYYRSLKTIEDKGFVTLPVIPGDTVPNYSIFYLIARSLRERKELLENLNNAGIQAITHYLDLSESPYIKAKQLNRRLTNNNRNSKIYRTDYFVYLCLTDLLMIRLASFPLKY